MRVVSVCYAVMLSTGALVALASALSDCKDPGPLGGLPDVFAPGDAGVATFQLDSGAFDVFPESAPGQTTSVFTGQPAYAAPSGKLPGNVAQPDGSTHWNGTSCDTCHKSGGACGAAYPCLAAGGTVYQDYKGTVPAAGVELRAVDGMGHSVVTWSGALGNFAVLPDAGLTGALTVGMRTATSTRPMVTIVPFGGCATAGACHVLGGSPEAGSYFPIHMP